jgi:hypothetical protein
VSRVLEWFACWRGSRFFAPCLKGRGPFIDGHGVPQPWYSSLITRVKLRDKWGPQAKKYHLWSQERVARLSSWLLSVDVVGTMDGISGGCCLRLLYLAAMLTLIGVMWRSYAATCKGLQTMTDELGYRAFWQASSCPIRLYKIRAVLDFPPGGCVTPPVLL